MTPNLLTIRNAAAKCRALFSGLNRPGFALFGRIAEEQADEANTKLKAATGRLEAILADGRIDPEERTDYESAMCSLHSITY